MCKSCGGLRCRGVVDSLGFIDNFDIAGRFYFDYFISAEGRLLVIM